MLTWLVAEAWIESYVTQIMKKPGAILAPEVPASIISGAQSIWVHQNFF